MRIKPPIARGLVTVGPDSRTPVRSPVRYAAKMLRVFASLLPVQPSMLLQANAPIQTRFSPEHRAQSFAMRALLNLTMALLWCALTFFRSRREQVIIELALRQQLATYA